MGPLGILCVLVGFLFGILFFAVAIFQIACKWCGLERPNSFFAGSIVFISWIVWAIFEGIMIAVLQELYRAAGYPPWEARIVGFFLGLPCHMVVTTGVHMAFMRVSFGKSIEVWFAHRLIMLGIVLLIAGVVAVGFLASKR